MYDYRKEQAARYRQQIETDTFTDADGCVRWNMGNAVPMDIFRDAGLPIPEGAEAAYERHLSAFMADYRAAQANRSPEAIAEQRAEARAAMGPGEDMVNIITGERYTT